MIRELIQVLWELKLRQLLGPSLRKRTQKYLPVANFTKTMRTYCEAPSQSLERGPTFKLHYHNSKSSSVYYLSPLEKGNSYTPYSVSRKEWSLLAKQNDYLNLPPHRFPLTLRDWKHSCLFLSNSFFSLKQWFPKCGPQTKLDSLGNVLYVQVLRPCPRSTESETWKLGLYRLCFGKTYSWFRCMLQFEHLVHQT